MVASAQRFLCSTGSDEFDAQWSTLSKPSVQGQDCCCRGTRDQDKFRNGARSFKEQQKRAIVLRLEPLSKRLPEIGRVLSENRQDVTEMVTDTAHWLCSK